MRGTRVPCVGGLVLDDEGRFLLVRRGHEPDKGRWSVPGGRVEYGESRQEATAREVLEETGLAVGVGELVGEVERDAPGGVVYVIRDYLCRPLEGVDPSDVHAGDDADEVGWFTVGEMRTLECSRGLVETFQEWGLFEPQ